MNSLSFYSTRKKISWFFCISASFLVLITSLATLFWINRVLKLQAKTVLQNAIQEVITDYQSDTLEEKETKYQSRIVGQLPNVADLKKDSFKSKKSAAPNNLPVGETDFSQLQENQAVYSRVILKNGDILFSSDLFDNNYILPDKSGFYQQHSGSSCFYILSQAVSTGETIQVGQYCALTQGETRTIYLLVGLITFLVSVLSFVVGWIFSGIILKPYQRIITQAKVFAQNVYHEILTPITVAITSVEAALASKKYLRGLKSVKVDLNEAQKSLDLLSKKTLQEKSITTLDSIDLVKVFNQVFDQCLKTHPNHRLDFKINHASQVIKKTNQSSVRLVFKNILQNVFKYAKPGSKVKITLNKNEFNVQNQVKDPNQIDTSQFFKRFYQGENGKDGQGLGLALVKEICDAYSWKTKAWLNKNTLSVKILL